MKEKAIGKFIAGLLICLMLGLVFGGLIDATCATSEKTTVSVTESSPWFTKGTNSGSGPWYSHTYDGHDYISTYVGGMSGNPSQPDCWAKFKPYLSQSGKYEVYAYFYACKDTSTKVPFTVKYDGGSTTIKVNQYRSSPAWKEKYLGTWDFKAGADTYVKVTDATGEPYDGCKGLTIGSIKFMKKETVPTPVITGIDPSQPTVSSTRQWITIIGTGFVSDSTVTLCIGSSTYPIPADRTEFKSSTQIRVYVGLTDPGTWTARVTNPGNRLSNLFSFTVKQDIPTPAITGIDPSQPTVSSTRQWITIIGTGFVSDSTVTLRIGSSTYPIPADRTEFKSSTQIRVYVGLTDPGTWTARVTNPGNRLSNLFSFTVKQDIPTPAITGIDPSQPTVSPTRQWITIIGTDFVSDSTVTLCIGSSTYPIPADRTEFKSSTQIRVYVGLTDPGTWTARVTNPGNRLSNLFSFTVKQEIPTPAITGIDPSQPTVSPTRQWITIIGTGFVSDSTVTLRIGSSTYPIPADRTEFKSSTQIRVYVGLTDPGTWTAQVTNPGNRLSNLFSFTVKQEIPTPVITGIDPSQPTVSPTRQWITIIGTGFVSDSTVTLRIGSSTYPIPADRTEFKSSTQIRVYVGLTDPGTWTAQVTNPGNRLSNLFSFTVEQEIPTPVITGIDPSQPTASPTRQWITIIGTGFVSDSTVTLRIGSSTYPIPADRTEFKSSTQIRVYVGLTDPGTWTAQVTNPGNRLSNLFSFTVEQEIPSPVHDMAVTDVYTSPDSPTVGQSTTIYVTVKNEGNQQEKNVLVKTYVDGSQVGSTQHVTLSAGKSTTKSFSWIPSTAKTYSVKGEIGVISGETDTSDNKKIIGVSVSTAPSPIPPTTPSPQTGSIRVTTTLDIAFFTITGPETYQAIGKSWSISNVPAGLYTITYTEISGYIIPSSETKTLSVGGSITFSGPYTKIGLYQLPATSGKISWFSSEESENPGAWGEWLGENLGTDEATKYWYCAMRWPYYDPNTGFFDQAAKDWWHNKKILLTNPKNDKQVVLAAKDWGPTWWTGRVIDVSKTALDTLGVETDDIVNIEFADQNAELGPPLSTKFKTGDLIVTKKKWNLRSDRKIAEECIKITLDKGSEGKVLENDDNGKFVPDNKYYWWYVKFGDYEGWCAEDGLKKSETAPKVAKPVLTSPLEITPEKDKYYVGDTLNAQFTITNKGTQPITFDKLLIGGRFNGGKLPNGEFPDFTFRSTTLQPNVPYQYAGTLTLTQSGNYHFFIAFYIENPTPEEKKLLDENNWNTCVDLGEGLTHTNRIKNIIVLEKELPPPGTVSESRDRINHNLQQQVKYPPYLPDPNSFPSAVATTWAKFTSWVTQTHLTERYDELYQTGIDYDCLSFKALKNARDSLDRGDTVSAEKYLQKSYTYEKLSAMSFGAAAEVFDDNLEAGEILAEGIKDGCEASVKFGLAITNPEAAKAADYLYIGVDYAVDRALVGEKPAAKKAIVKAGVTIIFNKIKFEDLGGRTIADYTENRIGKVTFPMLQKAFKNNEQIQFLASKIIKESGVKIGEKVAEDIATCSWNELEKAVNFEEIEVKSPVELRVYDSQGEVTGLINGEVEHGISRSVYDNGTAAILFPLDSYRYEAVGTGNGTYGLTVTSVEDGNATTFTAIDIPTTKGVRHQYAIDWNAISQGKNGTTLMIDSDGDGIFEKTVTADDELSQENYFALMPKTIYVPDDYAKIQYAVDNASAGDTIIVKSGTYYENVNVTKRLRLQGVDAGMGKPVVDAGGYGSPITLSVDRITLEGFKLINSGSSWVWDVGGDAGINVISNSNTIIGNIATNNYLDGIFLFRSRGNIVKGNIASNNGGGIILWRSSGNIIKDNTVRNNNCGIYLHLFSTNNTIIGNTASNNIYDGIALWLYSSSNNITGNTASKNGYEGISIYDSRGNIITGNTASNNNEYGICLYNSSSNTITGNTASNNMYDGVHLTASSNNTITGNTLNSNKYQGFLLGNSNGNTITKNTISNNREYGIQLINSKNNKIYLNNFINIGYTPRSSESSNIWNSIKPMTYRYKGSTFTNYPGNYWSDYTGSDADGDGIGVIPYVIDSDKDNYPLMETFENYISAP